MTLFSKRYQRALIDKALELPTIPIRTRTRVWKTMQDYCETWSGRDDTGWDWWTDHLQQTEAFLHKEYGLDKLVAYKDDDTRGEVEFAVFVQRCYKREFLDTIEAYYLQHEEAEKQGAFEREINRVLSEEGVPWRMSAGQLFQVDSAFLAAEVIARTEELLATNGYAGALDEFREARNDLNAGEHREAIAKAQHAFESTMKTIVGRSSVNLPAKKLIEELQAAGFYDDLPHDQQQFGMCVLMALPFLGNRYGRHGQGQAVVEIPRYYAELAVHLSGAFIRYLVERQLQLHPPSPPPPPLEEPPIDEDIWNAIVAEASDDDIPF